MCTDKLIVRRPDGPEEKGDCINIFTQSEPWKTLKMGKSYISDVLTNPLNEVYVLDIAGKIAGVIIIQLQGPFPGYIKSVAIGTEWRGQGLGKTLLEYAEKRIFKDFPNVFLCVSSFNKGAQAFYQRMGYQQVGEIADYVIEGASELLMRKKRPNG
ncbi:MAG: GNAT family N-acetyltransferase [Cyclobacteriaceae bacterium]|nr:GNAT family N-acetyltransferase [Cyclobacteriaceae bacterium]